MWWEPAHWLPPGVVAEAKPPFDPKAQQRYDPPISPQRQRLALLAFALLLAATAACLWWAHLLSPLQQLGGLGLVVLGLWIVARLCTTPSTTADDTSAETHPRGLSG